MNRRSAGRVRQIVRNVLTNAVRYGGPRMAVTVSEGAEMVRLEVADDGNPIPERAGERMFQPFTRATDTGRRHDSGENGLTVARQLAELRRGSPRRDHIDGGNRFTVNFPRPPG